MRNAFRMSAVVFVMAAVAGCGGSSYKGLSKADFVKQANAICAKTTKASDAFGKEIPSNPTAEQVTTIFLNKLVPLYRDQFDQIEALNPPKEDRDQVKKILDEARTETDAAVQEMKTNPEKFLKSTTDPYAQANKDANAYGLTVCGAT